MFTLPSTSASCPILSYLYTCTPVHTQWTHGHTVGFKGFPGGSDGKESTCNVGALGSIPGLGRSPGEGHGNPLQYSCLENPHGQRSLVGYSPWGHKESGITEHSSTHIHTQRPTLFLKANLGSSKAEYFQPSVNKVKMRTSLVVQGLKNKSACQCGRHGFNPWSGKIPHASKQLSPCTTTIEPVLLNLRATTTEP